MVRKPACASRTNAASPDCGDNGLLRSQLLAWEALPRVRYYGEPDCLPRPFDVLPMCALCQTVD